MSLLDRIHALMNPHRCALPRMPVVEDQRYWTCPECGVKWEWACLTDHLGTIEEWVMIA